MDPERIKEGLIDIKSYYENNGRKLYRGTISFVIGLPHEEQQGIHDTVSWLKENWKQQSFIPFALQIPSGINDNMSLMGSDFQKYGYEEINEVESSKEITPRISNNLVRWKNEHMNYADAERLESMMYQELYKKENKFTLNCWSLSSVALTGSVYDRLKHYAVVGSHERDTNHVFLSRIKTYKNKKLS